MKILSNATTKQELQAERRKHTSSLALLLCGTSFHLLLSPRAEALEGEFRSSHFFSAEGGWLSGTKVPLQSATQRDYDNESSKSGPGPAAEQKIRTLRLQGLEGVTTGTSNVGYELFSDNLNWQFNGDLVASFLAGNSTGTFFSPTSSPLFPTQGRGGRNSGWSAGAAAGVHWVPLSSFSTHLRGSFSTGSNSFTEPFSRLQLTPSLQIKAVRFIISPAYTWQRLLSGDALPAADVRGASIDVEWLGNDFLRFQNPNGYPLVKTWRATALGSPLVIRALENEGTFLEINLTPKIIFSENFFLTSHFRSVAATELSYIAPSLADAIRERGTKSSEWTPPAPSADYSSQTIEWKNTLTRRFGRNFQVNVSVLYTNKSSVFNPSSFSKLQYSTLIDTAGESSLRYFLGSEFLL
ncbi:MAG: hypothetical protein RIR26_629 [Pseudomonadota bacterium]